MHSTVVGSFDITGTDARHLNCTNLPEASTVTQTNFNGKTSVELTWRAPHDVPDGGFTVKFHYTIIQTFSVFWANKHSNSFMMVGQ